MCFLIFCFSAMDDMKAQLDAKQKTIDINQQNQKEEDVNTIKDLRDQLNAKIMLTENHKEQEVRQQTRKNKRPWNYGGAPEKTELRKPFEDPFKNRRFLVSRARRRRLKRNTNHSHVRSQYYGGRDYREVQDIEGGGDHREGIQDVDEDEREVTLLPIRNFSPYPRSPCTNDANYEATYDVTYDGENETDDETMHKKQRLESWFPIRSLPSGRISELDWERYMP